MSNALLFCCSWLGGVPTRWLVSIGEVLEEPEEGPPKSVTGVGGVEDDADAEGVEEDGLNDGEEY